MKKIKKASLLFPKYIKIKKSPLQKLEYSKEETEKNEFKKNVKYKPINPHRTFNPSTIGINEIMKKNNLSLIKNNTIKNIIIRFWEERLRKQEEKRILHKNKSFHDYEEEKKTHFIMLKALLRKDHQTIQTLIKKERKRDIKQNRCTSSRNLSYFGKSFSKKLRNKSAPITSTNKHFALEKDQKSKTIIIKSRKKDIWNEECLPKFDKNARKFSKKSELKIKSASSLTISGKVSNHKNMYVPSKKLGQDVSFSLLNINSVKLGEVSLFGVLDGNGPYGKQLSAIVKDYIIDYFKKCEEMKTTLKRDNFYSIMYNSFTNAQNYIINNIEKLNINLDYSGVTGCILLYPFNNSNKVYCANLGRSKCMLYTMFGTIRLSYELYPERASEKYRISLLQKNKDKFIITSNLNEDISNLNKNEEMNININDNKNVNMSNDNNKDKEASSNNNQKVVNENTKSQIDEKDKDTYIKDFNELNISRSIGNLIGVDKGIIPGPEVVESDVRMNRGKYIVMGTSSLWKYLTDDEVGDIVNKYLNSGDTLAACKELEETAKDRWKSNTGGYDDISVVVIFFDFKNFDIGK